MGEYWTDMRWEGAQLLRDQDAARQALCDWIDGNGANAATFDFPLKGNPSAIKSTQYRVVYVV